MRVLATRRVFHLVLYGTNFPRLPDQPRGGSALRRRIQTLKVFETFRVSNWVKYSFRENPSGCVRKENVGE